jgi:hypothetical protein
VFHNPRLFIHSLHTSHHIPSTRKKQHHIFVSRLMNKKKEKKRMKNDFLAKGKTRKKFDAWSGLKAKWKANIRWEAKICFSCNIESRCRNAFIKFLYVLFVLHKTSKVSTSMKYLKLQTLNAFSKRNSRTHNHNCILRLSHHLLEPYHLRSEERWNLATGKCEFTSRSSWNNIALD